MRHLELVLINSPNILLFLVMSEMKQLQVFELFLGLQ